MSISKAVLNKVDCAGLTSHSISYAMCLSTSLQEGNGVQARGCHTSRQDYWQAPKHKLGNGTGLQGQLPSDWAGCAASFDIHWGQREECQPPGKSSRSLGVVKEHVRYERMCMCTLHMRSMTA